MKMSLYESDVEISEKFHTSQTFQKAIDEGVRLCRDDSPDFYDFTGKIIREAYGELGPSNFNSISHAAPWFCHRQNLIERMLECYYKNKNYNYKPKRDENFCEKFHRMNKKRSTNI